MLNQKSYSQSVYNFLLLSFLLHAIFYILILLRYPVEDDSNHPSQYISAYTSSSYAVSSATSHRQKSYAQTKKSDAIGLKPRQKTQFDPKKQSILASSLEVLRNDSLNHAIQQRQMDKELEPVYLIGDPDHPASGIILVLAKALSAHFSYPRVAGELGIRGRVIIAVTLHPDGHFSDIVMMKSSDSQDLDAAALYAVNSAPLAEGADRFLSQPKRFIIGYIFR